MAIFPQLPAEKVALPPKTAAKPAPLQSVHRKFRSEDIRIVGTVRGRGRKPEGACITSKLTEGDVRLRRAIFRKLKQCVVEEYSDLAYYAFNNLFGFDSSFFDLFD